MSKSVSDNLSEMGNSVADATKSVGSKIAQGAENVVDFVKEKTGAGIATGEDVGVDGIREHMDVIASCGKTVGVVDNVGTSSIKLTRKDSPDDLHHFIPLSWVSHVGAQVHLNRNSKQAMEGWLSSDSCETSDSCGCDA